MTRDKKTGKFVKSLRTAQAVADQTNIVIFGLLMVVVVFAQTM